MNAPPPTALSIADRPPGTAREAAADPVAPWGPEIDRRPRWLQEVYLRLARRVQFVRHRWQTPGYTDEHLLAISHSEVDRALASSEESIAQEGLFQRQDPTARALTEELAALAQAPEDPRWAHLVSVLELEPAETALLSLAVAAMADAQLGRVLGYVADGVAPSGATPALAAELYPGISPLGPQPSAPALAWGVLRPAVDAHEAITSATAFTADRGLALALLGPGTEGNGPAARWSIGCVGVPLPAPADPAVRPEQVRQIADFVTGVASGRWTGAIEVEIVGPPGSGRRTLATRIAAELGRTLVTVDGTALAAEPDPPAALIRELRRTVLEGTVLAITAAERVSVDQLPGPVRAALARCRLRFSCVERPAPAPAAGAIRGSFSVTELRRAERLALWSRLSADPPPTPVTEWALRPAEMVAVAAVAPAGEKAVADVCRRMLAAGTGELLTQLPLPYDWDDLVLAPSVTAHLRELETQARSRAAVLDDWGLSRLTPMGRGTTALFAGPSGTGKTMAAQVLARSLGLECVRVDLAGVVSKYIGETEKQLRQVFDACERAPALLLFDEADALFGKRTQVSDAHDRYANIEIDYLLQQMERFDGLAVLATNRRSDLDTAFVRRMRFIVQFSPPSVTEREQLWRLCLEDARDAAGGSLVGALDYPAIAAELDLTGADIKSSALAAAYRARSEGTRIELRHVFAAARRELEKQGQVVRPGQLERR